MKLPEKIIAVSNDDVTKDPPERISFEQFSGTVLRVWWDGTYTMAEVQWRDIFDGVELRRMAMGVIYAVVCRDCQVQRNLDKFRLILSVAKSRGDALGLAKEVEGDSFRAALLVSFMGEHLGHNCTVVSDVCDEMPFAEDRDFWKVSLDEARKETA